MKKDGTIVFYDQIVKRQFHLFYFDIISFFTRSDTCNFFESPIEMSQVGKSYFSTDLSDIIVGF